MSLFCSRACIRLALLACLAGCRAAQPAYFSPASTAYPYRAPDTGGQRAPATAIPAELPTPGEGQTPAPPAPISDQAIATQPAIYQHVEILKSRAGSGVPAPQLRHGNPDLGITRRPAWLYTTQLMAEPNVTYVAQRIMPSDLPAKRQVPRGVVYALAGSILPYGLLLVTHLPAWAWVLSLTLPLAAMLLAAGALTKIRRNKAQFRGRGWAALALILATSYVGMALVTLAALATSGILWE